MSAFVFSDHPVDDLIRKNLNIGGVYARAARNKHRGAGADIAVANAHEAYGRAVELVRTLPDEQRGLWCDRLLSLQGAIHRLGEITA